MILLLTSMLALAFGLVRTGRRGRKAEVQAFTDEWIQYLLDTTAVAGHGVPERQRADGLAC
jgi:hypothetical protein